MTDRAALADELARLAAKATPGRLETAETSSHDDVIECPVCDGCGEVDASNYCNFDHKALGVQFYGIGEEFGAHEALWSKLANNLSTIIAALRAEPAKPVDREKVARALYCVEGRATTWDRQESALWAHYMDEHRGRWLKLADAAIAAMGGE